VGIMSQVITIESFVTMLKDGIEIPVIFYDYSHFEIFYERLKKTDYFIGYDSSLSYNLDKTVVDYIKENIRERKPFIMAKKIVDDKRSIRLESSLFHDLSTTYTFDFSELFEVDL
jgi:hypothetical protein